MSSFPANRLKDATSPYLLQHAHNPVDWYPWGDDAFAEARRRDAPVFLSIGYAACHWCHVMERESFENPALAQLLNRDFVAVKVDREERPDLDEIYMTVTQLLTGSGGWPMSVFLTPEARPFYAGTYFPPEDRWGRPGFTTLLREIRRAWDERRDQVEEQAERILDGARTALAGPSPDGKRPEMDPGESARELLRGYDPRHGGFGSAPKFPPAMRLEVLLLEHLKSDDPACRRTVEHTLDAMARGGMYDHVGGGFHRYSVDAEWLVPHFEKMLYDNALLGRLYARAGRALQSPRFLQIAREILDYVLREMTHPEGGFYSTTDADSRDEHGEMEEGAFFVWTPDQIRAVLGEADGQLFCTVYDVAPGGNFEGRSIPNLRRRSVEEHARDLGLPMEALEARLLSLRARLREARENRPHPLLDDKILTAWNGLMIRAMVEGHAALGDERYLAAARRAADFVLTRLRREGRLLRSFRGEEAGIPAFLEDYGALALALLELAAAGDEPRYAEEGVRLLGTMEALFADPISGGYFFTASDQEPLIARPGGFQDGATPSGASLAVLAHLRAARLPGGGASLIRARQVLALAATPIREFPHGFPHMLVAAHEAEELAALYGPWTALPPLSASASPPIVQAGGEFTAVVVMDCGAGGGLTARIPASGPDSAPVGGELPPGFQWGPLRRTELPGDILLDGQLRLERPVRTTPDCRPGEHVLTLRVRLAPCDAVACYPALEGSVPLTIRVELSPVS